MFPENWTFHIAPALDRFVWWLVEQFGYVFDSISTFVLSILLAVRSFFWMVPWWVFVMVFAIIAWYTTRRLATTALITVLLVMVGIFGLWRIAMDTLALVVTSVSLSLVIGIPLGIIMSETNVVELCIEPILDGMQTMPSFVYLIPAIMLFGLGRVSGVIATVIYAVPPVTRLTNLGLRQVPEDIIEAAEAFGSTRWQILRKVRFPLAYSSVLLGVNQTIMMALSMSVIASMIGAGGLGERVLWAINRIQVGAGFEAGISIVALAIVVDRISRGIANR